MIVKIQFRLANGAEWSTSNAVLDEGEPGYDTTANAMKVGDGVTPWNDLTYQSADPATFTAILNDAQSAAAAAEASAQAAEAAANLAGQLELVPSTGRPDPVESPGLLIFDTDLGQPIVSDGTAWVDMAGTAV